MAAIFIGFLSLSLKYTVWRGVFESEVQNVGKCPRSRDPHTSASIRNFKKSPAWISGILVLFGSCLVHLFPSLTESSILRPKTLIVECRPMSVGVGYVLSPIRRRF